MAHGQDVANLGQIRARRRDPAVVGRAGAVIANSRWLADRLVDRDPGRRGEARGRSIAASTSTPSPRAAAEARRELGWDGERPGAALRRVADRAQERGRARRRVRDPRPWPARLRRGRPAARARSRAAPACGSSGASRRPRCRAGSPPATCSASRRGSSPSARRRWRGWRWSAASSRRRSAARPSSSPPEAGVLVDPRRRRGAGGGARAGRRAAVAEPGRRARRRPSTTSAARPPEWPRCSSGLPRGPDPRDRAAPRTRRTDVSVHISRRKRPLDGE